MLRKLIENSYIGPNIKGDMFVDGNPHMQDWLTIISDKLDRNYQLSELMNIEFIVNMECS